MTNIYSFDHDHMAQCGKSPKELKDLLGGKGANLAEMTSVLGLPVPHGFTITTDACRDFLASGWDASLEDDIATAVEEEVEAKMGRKFGQPNSGNPLLLSVRSGAKFSMPGMMDTILNLGLNDATVLDLANAFSSRRFAYDSYRRFISMYARIVHGVDGRLFDEAVEELETQACKSVETFTFDEFLPLSETFKRIYAEEVGEEFPQDVYVQLNSAIKAVFDSWNSDRAKAYREIENIPDDIGTAVNVQAMVFGNRNDKSGTGVAFTRNPTNGDPTPYGDFLIKAQGEDVVAGTHKTLSLNDMRGPFTSAAQELDAIFKTLEKHYEDMCDIEFTVEDQRLWLLQTRVGKRTNAAAIRMAVDMAQGVFRNEWALTKAEAVERVADILATIPEKKVVDTSVSSDEFAPIVTGLAASPGSATGQAAFTADEAVKLVNDGKKVILVREETSPDDIHGMQVSEGILTQKGGLVSHAAVVARGWNIPAVVGASDLTVEADHFLAPNGLVVNSGDTITIDGATGNVYPGKVNVSSGKDDSHYLDLIRGWAAKVETA